MNDKIKRKCVCGDRLCPECYPDEEVAFDGSMTIVAVILAVTFVAGFVVGKFA